MKCTGMSVLSAEPRVLKQHIGRPIPLMVLKQTIRSAVLIVIGLIPKNARWAKQRVRMTVTIKDIVLFAEAMLSMNTALAVGSKSPTLFMVPPIGVLAGNVTQLY